MTPKPGEALERVESARGGVGGPGRRWPRRERAERAGEWSPLEPDSESEPTLRDLLAVVAGERRLVAAVAAASLLLGAAYAWLAQPIFRADMLLQVEEAKKGGALGELSALFSESSPAETEIEILRSRSLVGAAVDELRLELHAAPSRFPLVGAAIARAHAGDGPAGAWPGFGRWGWGGERIALSRLELPPAALEDPPFLVAGEGGAFELRSAQGATLATGRVGELVRSAGVELYVSELVARPGTRFAVARRSRELVIARLQRELKITERGKKTGILQVSLDGGDRERAAAILDSLARAYVRQNADRRSAEAEQALAFLESQLPTLRSELHTAEARLEAHRRGTGGVDVTLETQAAVARAADVEKAIAEATVELGVLRKRFTEVHPTLAAARARLSQLQADRAAVEARLRRLPESELVTARLLRDVKVANELYLSLLDKAQELKVVKSGTIASVRVLDRPAASSLPVSAGRAAVLAIALLLGLAAGTAAAFVRRAFDDGVEDPEEIERITGVPVHASIPLSARQRAADQTEGQGAGRGVLSASVPDDITVESIRSLRTSLQFALLDAPAPIVAITGPAPAVGKSFVASNLAHVAAEGGRRVLLVDADLRRGGLHEQLGGERTPGLSEVLAGEVTWQAAVRQTGSLGVKLLATGSRPPNPSVLLEGERFGRLLTELSGAFDLVLIDTPPILAVTDASLVAAHASIALCVLRAGRHPMREISAALRRFAHGGVRIDGFVLNGVELGRGLGARSAYHYHYSYE